MTSHSPTGAGSVLGGEGSTVAAVQAAVNARATGMRHFYRALRQYELATTFSAIDPRPEAGWSVIDSDIEKGRPGWSSLRNAVTQLSNTSKPVYLTMDRILTALKGMTGVDSQKLLTTVIGMLMSEADEGGEQTAGREELERSLQEWYPQAFTSESLAFPAAAEGKAEAERFMAFYDSKSAALLSWFEADDPECDLAVYPSRIEEIREGHADHAKQLNAIKAKHGFRWTQMNEEQLVGASGYRFGGYVAGSQFISNDLHSQTANGGSIATPTLQGTIEEFKTDVLRFFATHHRLMALKKAHVGGVSVRCTGDVRSQ